MLCQFKDAPQHNPVWNMLWSNLHANSVVPSISVSKFCISQNNLYWIFHFMMHFSIYLLFIRYAEINHSRVFVEETCGLLQMIEMESSRENYALICTYLLIKSTKKVSKMLDTTLLLNIQNRLMTLHVHFCRMNWSNTIG